MHSITVRQKNVFGRFVDANQPSDQVQHLKIYFELSFSRDIDTCSPTEIINYTVEHEHNLYTPLFYSCSNVQTPGL